MARKKANLLNDLLSIFSKLPWWVGVMAAAIAYLALHHLATTPFHVPPQPGHVIAPFWPSIVQGLSIVGQYVLPMIFLAGAAISAIQRRRRTAMIETVAESTEADPLKDMTWQDFEQLVGEAFRHQGYKVTETDSGPDGGIDLMLKKDGEIYLVQCKHWRATKVGVPIVRELFGVMSAKGAAGAFVVTSGQFTREAKAFASGRNIELINGKKLQSLIRAGRNHANTAGATSVESTAESTPASSTTSTTAPSCPRCGSTMVKRTAKRGKNAGRSFWGCSNYPTCRGIQQIN